MKPKVFQMLRARIIGKSAQLSFYISRGFVENRPPAWRDMVLDKIRILRAEDSLGESAQYDEEYYDDMPPAAAKLIFEGPMAPVNNVKGCLKYEFVDTNVRFRQTYAYWVCTPYGDPPVGPEPLRMRDPKLWWPHNRTEQFMEELSRKYPDIVTLHEFGKTTLNHPLRGLIIGNAENTIALTSGIHPRECGGPELLLPIAELLASDHRHLLEQIGVAILPCANHEVRERFVHGLPWLLRCNPNGVDLNRNFDANWEEVSPMYGYMSDDPDGRTYRGPTPNSESETQALVRFLKTTRPKAVFSYHGIGGADFAASEAAKEDAGYRKACEHTTSVYTRGFGDGRQPKTIYLTSSGSMPTWVYQHLGVPAFDVEGFETQIERAALMDEHTPAMLEEYTDRHRSAITALLETLAET